MFRERLLTEAELETKFREEYEEYASLVYTPGLFSPYSNRMDRATIFLLDERINALETWISNRLAQVAQERRGESLRVVTSTLDRIGAFRAARLAAVPSPRLFPVPRLVRQGPTSKLFTLHGEPNVPYQIQTSANLRDWSSLLAPIYRGQDFSGSVSSSAQFYRASVQP